MDVPEENEHTPLLTDFPFEAISKADFRLIEEPGVTFGNDKIVTSRNYRPAYVMSISNETTILTIPVKCLEDSVKKLANSGENKEKTDFFNRFKWFDNFTQSLKTKFNNCTTKKIFYPGATLIREGTNNKMAYVIVSGECNLVLTKTGHRFTMLEYENDPTKKRRDQELNYQKQFKQGHDQP